MDTEEMVVIIVAILMFSLMGNCIGFYFGQKDIKKKIIDNICFEQNGSIYCKE